MHKVGLFSVAHFSLLYRYVTRQRFHNDTEGKKKIEGRKQFYYPFSLTSHICTVYMYYERTSMWNFKSTVFEDKETIVHIRTKDRKLQKGVQSIVLFISAYMNIWM